MVIDTLKRSITDMYYKQKLKAWFQPHDMDAKVDKVVCKLLETEVVGVVRESSWIIIEFEIGAKLDIWWFGAPYGRCSQGIVAAPHGSTMYSWNNKRPSFQTLWRLAEIINKSQAI